MAEASGQHCACGSGVGSSTMNHDESGNSCCAGEEGSSGPALNSQGTTRVIDINDIIDIIDIIDTIG